MNPPSFYDDVSPPPLLTPPPNYDDLTPRIEVRDGYFDLDGSESNSDENTGSEGTFGEPEDSRPEQEEHRQQHQEEEEEEEEEEEDDDLEQGDIVDMVGLEDLSLGWRNSTPILRRSGDYHGTGNWQS
jgi:hypothetical protein